MTSALHVIDKYVYSRIKPGEVMGKLKTTATTFSKQIRSIIYIDRGMREDLDIELLVQLCFETPLHGVFSEWFLTHTATEYRETPQATR